MKMRRAVLKFFAAVVSAWGASRMIRFPVPVTFANEESKPEIVVWLEEARDVHLLWAKVLRNDEPLIVYGKHTTDEVEFTKRAARMIVGPPEYHEEWAARYDKILAEFNG